MNTFISYSHLDEYWFNQLRMHIAPLLLSDVITIWSDHQILAGQPLESNIKEKLETAELFILLLSPAYLASKSCLDELNFALSRSVKVIPIIVEACKWNSTQLRDYKIIPKDAKPIRKWQDQNSAFVEVVEEIERVVNESQEKSIFKSDKKISKPHNSENLLTHEFVEYLSQGRMNFSGIAVTDLRLINFDLQKINLSESTITGAKLQGSNLEDSILVNANLQESDFFAANLTGTNLRGSNLKSSNLMGTKIKYANFRAANMEDTILVGSNLEGSYLENTNLNQSDLSFAKLICANLWFAKLNQAKLVRAILIGVNLISAQLKGAVLKEADLSFANLSGADLRFADLSKVNLEGANMLGANLENANLIGTNLDQVDLTKVNI